MPGHGLNGRQVQSFMEQSRKGCVAEIADAEAGPVVTRALAQAHEQLLL